MNSLEKFQNLLRELFQFESSDLDFGIYRILNYKRKEIEKFINEGLKDKVESAFAKHRDERLADIERKFEEIKQKVIENLGKDAITLSGDIKEEFKNTPIGKEFLSIKERKEEAEKIEEIKLQVFNDLYNFFSRYYEDGDFIPQYRYSIKKHKYAIPYNGEEVKLYWVNYDQYYTKTGLLFRDYTFKVNGYKVVFRVVEAKEELNSNKATKERFFVLDNDNPITYEYKTLVIRFQYRELTEEEVKHYEVEGGSNTSKQEKINQRSYEEILDKLEDDLLKKYLTNTKNDKPLLLYHLNRFSAKNTRDYFIHKNLKKFLSEQLDYFIKSEVLDIETIERDKYFDKHITRVKVVREIGEAVIDFLSQIEDFQKKLWEKKKFVLKTEYVITTDRIPEEFYDEIWKNEEQRKEWQELGFEIPDAKEELKNKKLPVDTRYFPQEFKEKLLEKLTENANLDDLLDGLLIKSENWQALNTILNKYKGQIKTIYIDPPYNTGNDGFSYKDKYQHSTWLTMMENRLSLARELMSEDGVIFISIDDNEVGNLIHLLDIIYGDTNRITTFSWEKTHHYGRQKMNYYYNRDFIVCYAKQLYTTSGQLKELLVESIKTHLEDAPLYNAINKSKVLVFPPGSVIFKIPDGVYDKSYDDKFELLEPVEVKNGINISPLKIKLRSRWSQTTIDEAISNGCRFLVKSGKFALRVIYGNNIQSKIAPRQIIFTNPQNPYLTKDKFGEKVGTNEEGSRELLNLFNYEVYTYPKPTSLIKYLLSLNSNDGDLILDFFAGSGTTAHAVMKLNKEDGGKRKFILVEMADYFNTVIIPRIKKVAYSFNWKEGKPQDEDGIGVFLKYQSLEQYEDTLDNIELKEDEKVKNLFKDEYLLKYFLDFETKESPYLLNIQMLKNPFNYKLKVNLSEVGEPQEMVVDIPETFNYLLGLKVKKIKARNHNNRKYLFILGEKDGKNVAVAWREYEDSWSEEDFMEDKKFIVNEIKSWNPQIVYINGQSVLTGQSWEVRYIEPEFKRLMEG